MTYNYMSFILKKVRGIMVNLYFGINRLYHILIITCFLLNVHNYLLIFGLVAPKNLVYTGAVELQV